MTIDREELFSIIAHLNDQKVREDPETFLTLIQFAIESKHKEVKAAQKALKILSGYFKDHPNYFISLTNIGIEAKCHKIAAESVNLLAAKYIHEPDFLATLKTIAVNSKTSGGAAAVRVIVKHFLGDSQTFDILKLIALKGKYYAHSEAVLALGKHYSQELETLSLITLLKHNQIWGKSSIVVAISENFPHEPENLDLLKTLAMSDCNGASDAVWAIAHYYRDHPEILSWLKTFALRNSKGALSAVKAIALGLKNSQGKFIQHFRDYPESFLTLQTIAFEASCDQVAQIALTAITLYFPEHPETFLTLTNIAFESPSNKTRQIAVGAIAWQSKNNSSNSLPLKIFRRRHLKAIWYLTRKYFRNEPESFYPWKSIIFEDFNKRITQEAISDLGVIFKNHPETFSTLKTIALAHPCKWSARRALWVMSDHFNNDPETFSIFKTIALKHSSDLVAELATWLIGRMDRDFTNNPETFSVLKTLAMKHPGYRVASEAARFLGVYYRNHPEIVALESPLRCHYIYRGVIIPETYGKIPLENWQPHWLLTETNAEVRRVLIQGIGYEKICQELNAVTLDRYREYSLVKIHIPQERESIVLLKMTCPSTGHIHILRVPPESVDAREAITWINWGIDPEELAIET